MLCSIECRGTGLFWPSALANDPRFLIPAWLELSLHAKWEIGGFHSFNRHRGKFSLIC